MKFDEVLKTLSDEFIPKEQEYSSFEHLFVSIEEAFWMYHDVYRQQHPAYPPFSLKNFADAILQHSPSVLPFYHGMLNVTDFDQMVEKFSEYKRKLPRFGAVLLNPALDSVLLVKDKSGWGFPRGKGNEHETDAENATREILEETGYDIKDKIQTEEFISRDFLGSFFKLFIIPNVPDSTEFSTQTRHEIKEIAWQKIGDIPMYNTAAKQYYMVGPFVRLMKDWIREYARKMDIPFSFKRSARTSSGSTPSTPTSPFLTPSKSTPNSPYNSTPPKKRKLSTPTSFALPIPPPPTPNKTPKAQINEYCMALRIDPKFSRHSAVLSPSPTLSPNQGAFTVTLYLPPPIDKSFNSARPARSAREAEHSACEVALEYLRGSSHPSSTPSVHPTFPTSDDTDSSPLAPSSTGPASPPSSLAGGLATSFVPSIPPSPSAPAPSSDAPSEKEFEDPFSVNGEEGSSLIGPNPPPSSFAPLDPIGYPAPGQNKIMFLNELCTKRKWPTPIYSTIRQEGPPHKRLFVVQVTVFTGIYTSGRGYSTVKIAKEQAAAEALRNMVF